MRKIQIEKVYIHTASGITFGNLEFLSDGDSDLLITKVGILLSLMVENLVDLISILVL